MQENSVIIKKSFVVHNVYIYIYFLNLISLILIYPSIIFRILLLLTLIYSCYFNYYHYNLLINIFHYFIIHKENAFHMQYQYIYIIPLALYFFLYVITI